MSCGENEANKGTSYQADYADQRYYSNQFARFMTTDAGSANPRNPQSWNRYAYVENDPINHNDPTGMLFKEVWDDGICGGDWIFDASLSGPCGFGIYLGPTVTAFDRAYDRWSAKLDPLSYAGLIDDWSLTNNNVDVTVNWDARFG